MATRIHSAFVAYPVAPADLVEPITRAVTALQVGGSRNSVSVLAWPNMPVFGASIPDEVREQIRSSDVLVCDVTVPNMNVYYEAGFAIGQGKAVAPIVNTSFADASNALQLDGLFDNIGYKRYENSEQLITALKSLPSNNLVDLYGRQINHQQPLFLLDTFRKTDFRNAIVSAIKASAVFYRSFDPVEVPRLSTVSVLAEITASAGVVIPILAPHVDDAPRHNLRAAFLAGLSHGLGRKTLLVEMFREDSRNPADYRQLVHPVRHADEVGELVRDFAQAALIEAQSINGPDALTEKTALQRLRLGAPTAENEFRTLGEYFVETAEFLRTMRGEINVVAGRKGAGKTAIFFRFRDTIRDDFRQGRNCLAIDLKPESHQLSLFREEILKIVGVGVFDHTLAAFWYYVILSEILLALKKQAERRGRFDNQALAKAARIRTVLGRYDTQESGDFTARINHLSSLIIQELRAAGSRGRKLSADDLTNIIFKHGVADFRGAIQENSDDDAEFVFLFDNIDKGWPANGVHEFDVRLVRLLVETLDKVKRDFHANHREFLSVVFLRNDVYELMVDATPDRGKSGQVRIDWTDRAKLRQVIYRRLQSSTEDKSATFEEMWRRFFTFQVGERDSFEYFVDHSLMRPRFLIMIIENAIANAINRGHEVVLEEDCKDAVLQHSNYLVAEFGYEIRDVSGVRADILYSLLGAPEICTRDEIVERFLKYGLAADEADAAFRLMLWYGVVGIVNRRNENAFIYDFGYDVRRLEAEIRMLNGDEYFVLNQAFQFH